MASYTFFHNPMSRGQIARWAFHEAGADYEVVHVPYEDKPAALMEANPMGKIPTIIHHRAEGDVVVSEAAAICHYLAEMEATALLPEPGEKADYFRWLFFAAGPVEAAVIAWQFGFDPADDPQKQMSAGWGSYDRAVDALAGWLGAHDYVCGARFTMADVYVGSQVDWGLQFKTLPERAEFTAYAERLRGREAYRQAKAIDDRLIEEAQAGDGDDKG